MTLRELIERFEKADPKKIVPVGFHEPHSYRGDYCDLAFEPTENISVGEMLKCAKEALGKTYKGYRGGDFKMSEYTDVYIAFYGQCGDGISHMLLDYMLNELGTKD